MFGFGCDFTLCFYNVTVIRFTLVACYFCLSFVVGVYGSGVLLCCVWLLLLVCIAVFVCVWFLFKFLDAVLVMLVFELLERVVSDDL